MVVNIFDHLGSSLGRRYVPDAGCVAWYSLSTTTIHQKLKPPRVRWVDCQYTVAPPQAGVSGSIHLYDIINRY